MDPQLVRRARKGDERAFEALVVARHPTLFRTAFAILRDAELAEDATQRAFLDAWRFLPRVRDLGSFDTWLLGLLIEASRVAAQGAPSFEAGESDPSDPATAASDPFGTALARDQLSRAFRQLDFQERALLVLRYLVALQPAEAGAVLGLGPDAVATRAEEALKRLASAIDGDPASAGDLVPQAEGA